jgi:hypothetical protein
MTDERIQELLDEWYELTEPILETYTMVSKMFKEMHGFTDKDWEKLCTYSEREDKECGVVNVTQNHS